MPEHSAQTSRIPTALSRAGSVPRWIRSVGWQGTSAWLASEAKAALGFSESATMTINARGALHPVVARLRGASDMNVFSQIFAWEEYACMRSIPSPRWILDLGANVGYSSVYFLSCFPTASVIAVEPDPDNCDLCRRNLAPYGERARVVPGAAWSTRARLALSRGTFGDGREWATQVFDGAGQEGLVQGYDVPSLMEMTGGEPIDILKVDVERSELEIFGDTSSVWLPKVRNICIELHGADCREMFLRALRGFEYDPGSSGELTLCRNLRLKTKPEQSGPAGGEALYTALGSRELAAPSRS